MLADWSDSLNDPRSASHHKTSNEYAEVRTTYFYCFMVVVKAVIKSGRGNHNARSGFRGKAGK